MGDHVISVRANLPAISDHVIVARRPIYYHVIAVHANQSAIGDQVIAIIFGNDYGQRNMAVNLHSICNLYQSIAGTYDLKIIPLDLKMDDLEVRYIMIPRPYMIIMQG